MRKYYGTVSLELVDANSKSERQAYMLAEKGSDKMYELRPKNTPAFFNPDNSPFKPFRGVEVEIEGQPWNTNVVIVAKIRRYP